MPHRVPRKRTLSCPVCSHDDMRREMAENLKLIKHAHDISCPFGDSRQLSVTMTGECHIITAAQAAASPSCRPCHFPPVSVAMRLFSSVPLHSYVRCCMFAHVVSPTAEPR